MSTETEEIKSRIDIVELISRYLTLKKTGMNFAGLCPFHNEKTPSFMVNPERQIFKCFGCDVGGDIFDFVMKIEGLEFPEALKLLAEQAGVELKPISREVIDHAPNNATPKSRLLELNDFIAKAWHQILLKHPGAQKARDYLNRRQLSLKTIRDWQIGFAPPEYITEKLLHDKNFTPKEQAEAGKPQRLAGRIIFPIRDLVGKTVGFTGRVIDESQSGPKYLNTPETAIFHKSQIVFGLDKAKQAIRDHDFILLVEGQMDVVALHQEGYKMTVATSGTALTEKHLKILKRFSQNLIISFDQDRAGEEATKRALELAFQEDIIPSIVTIEAKDPADLILSDQKKWQQSLDSRQSFMAWLIDRAISRHGTKDGSAKKLIANEVLIWLSRIVNPVEKAHWVKYLADRARISETSINELLANTQLQKASRVEEDQPDQEHSTSPSILLIGLLSRYPQYIAQVQLPDWPTNPAADNSERQALKALTSWNGQTDFSRFLKKQAPEIQKLINLAHLTSCQLFQQTEPEKIIKEITLLQKRIVQEEQKLIKALYAEKIAQAEKSGDQTKVKKLIHELKDAILSIRP